MEMTGVGINWELFGNVVGFGFAYVNMNFSNVFEIIYGWDILMGPLLDSGIVHAIYLFVGP